MSCISLFACCPSAAVTVQMYAPAWLLSTLDIIKLPSGPLWELTLVGIEFPLERSHFTELERFRPL